MHQEAVTDTVCFSSACGMYDAIVAVFATVFVPGLCWLFVDIWEVPPAAATVVGDANIFDRRGRPICIFYAFELPPPGYR